MKKPITILVCCALLAPLAFAQPESKSKGQGPTTAEEITVTGTIIKMTSEDGSAANYQPAKTLVVREDRFNTPGSYVLNGPRSRREQEGRSHPNRDQTRHSCAYLLRKRRRFTDS